LRLAVFTSLFPGRINTFFARDMRGLIDAGIDVDIFSFYPLDSTLWRYVPDILSERFLPRNKVRHIGVLESLARLRPWPAQQIGRFAGDTGAISASALRFGIVPLAKSLYVFPKAWAWSRIHHREYDHVLAYWGNYSATCAYIFHRLMEEPVPFSMFLHAGIDLYEDQVYLQEKLRYADNIIVVCDFNRRFLEKLYPSVYPSIADKILEHHLGLDFAEFPYQPDGRQPRRILAVGTFAKYKGFEYLVMAAGELSRRGVDFELELVGDGKEGNALKALASKLSISEKVRFPGWLHPTEVRKAMEQTTIFVHPSNGIGDAVPTVIKEAIALGAPVVASDLAGSPELLDGGKCGILVPPANPVALADAIQLLLESADLRRSYAEAARKYAENKFDLWRNGRRLAEVLNSTERVKPSVALKSR
jgi:glycosyltransferase involved in cell wall biosynthesis